MKPSILIPSMSKPSITKKGPYQTRLLNCSYMILICASFVITFFMPNSWANQESIENQVNTEESLPKIFKTTLPDGSVEFSDAPSDTDSEIIQQKPLPVLDFKETNTTQYKKKYQSKDSQAFRPYHAISITSPSNEQTLRNIGGKLTISVRPVPNLRGGDQLVVLSNGIQVAGPSKSNRLTSNKIYRGTNVLTVNVIDQKGKVVISSPPVKIYVH